MIIEIAKVIHTHPCIKDAKVQQIKGLGVKRIIHLRPKIYVDVDCNGNYPVLDGSHRLEALKELGVCCVSVDIRNTKTTPFIDPYSAR